MTKSFSAFLDICRWMAALLVVISHVRHIALADFGQVNHPGMFLQMLYFITGLGHEAVVIFFVLSGLLVGGLSLKKWREHGIDFGDYFAHRFSRIYTVLLPALVAGYVLDYAGAQFFNASGIYTHAAQFMTNSLKANIAGDLSLKIFLGNLLMLESEYVPILGSNGPIWSLAYEWWYYSLFAAGMGVLLLNNMRSRLLCLVLLGVTIGFSPLHMLLWMTIWLLGVITLFYAQSRLPKLPPALCAILFAGALTLSRLNTHAVSTLNAPESLSMLYLYDLLIGVSYALLLASLYGYSGKLFVFSALHRKLADFSYSLYLTHSPMLILLMAVLYDHFGVAFIQPPDSRHTLLFFVLIMALYVYGYVFSLLTERHTAKVKALLSRWLGSRKC